MGLGFFKFPFKPFAALLIKRCTEVMLWKDA